MSPEMSHNVGKPTMWILTQTTEMAVKWQFFWYACIFLISPKTYIVVTRLNRLKAALTVGTHSLCFRIKMESTGHTLLYKSGELRGGGGGGTLNGHVSMMKMPCPLRQHSLIFYVYYACNVRYCEFLIMVVKMTIFRLFFVFIFLIFIFLLLLKHRLCVNVRGGSNEYPQSMFQRKNKKKCIPL